MTDGIYDPEDETLKLRMMLAKGLFPNPDGSVTEISKAVAEQMLRTIDQAEQGGAALDDDGLDYDVPACP
ncbi:MAG: hypothetical protein KDI90_00505 [Alphaproteobacteria bacterium]|nr:hypothetical protein [Alphaproteobacteria bacterium]MCB9974996.1 hypothetical protein [Rhodospirillales bacterium]